MFLQKSQTYIAYALYVTKHITIKSRWRRRAAKNCDFSVFFREFPIFRLLAKKCILKKTQNTKKSILNNCLKMHPKKIEFFDFWPKKWFFSDFGVKNRFFFSNFGVKNRFLEHKKKRFLSISVSEIDFFSILGSKIDFQCKIIIINCFDFWPKNRFFPILGAKIDFRSKTSIFFSVSSKY